MNETPEQVQVAVQEKKPNNKKILIIVVSVVVMLFIAQALFSPERVAERMIENSVGGNVDFNADDGQIEIKGEDGESMKVSTGKKTELPKDWPSSVPVFPNSSIDYVASVDGYNGGGVSHTVTLSTKESIEDVVNFYKDELVKNGWKIAQTITTSDGSMISATKDENNSVAVYIGANDDVTTVTITAVAEK